MRVTDYSKHVFANQRGKSDTLVHLHAPMYVRVYDHASKRPRASLEQGLGDRI